MQDKFQITHVTPTQLSDTSRHVFLRNFPATVEASLRRAGWKSFSEIGFLLAKHQ
jgi:hypothetical protein